MKKVISAGLVLFMLLSLMPLALAVEDVQPIPARPTEEAAVPAAVTMNWNGSTDTEQVKHHSYADYETLMNNLVQTYPDYCSLYSIGHTAQERQLWCLEITNRNGGAEEKTGIGVFGNIHGGEMESAESAMYTGWWMLVNADTEYMRYLLDNYVIYCVPMINPDGMEQSFVYNVRYNQSARDADGDGIVFSDPYTDVDGDGFISEVFIGKSGADTSALNDVRGSDGTNYLTDGLTLLRYLGMESPDWDLDGALGNDPNSSGIDLNRTFVFYYGRYDITTYNPNRVTFSGQQNVSGFGQNAWSTNGREQGPAKELEVIAVQEFLKKTPMAALVSLHTGIQAVLWPWCYKDTDYDEDPTLGRMAEIGKEMSQAFAETASSDGVKRGIYFKSSWNDYPTTSELIDYAYGRFGVHAYTIEVYQSGDSDVTAESGVGVYTNYDGTVSTGCSWQNGAQLANNAATSFAEYTYDEVIGTGEGCLGFSEAQAKAIGISKGQSLYFRTTGRAKMSGMCPTNMNLLVAAAKDAILTMIEKEPY